MSNKLLEISYSNALIQNEVSTAKWTNFKDEHKALSSRLLEYRDKLKHDIMVPIGRLALMRGQLVHTNEILVSLGDGWFVKQSSAEAAEICKRRIKDCEEMLKKLEKEKELLTSRMSFPMKNDIFGGNEIQEEYNEEREAKWREKHRESVRIHKQKEAEERKKTKEQEEKDIFELLEALELQEEEEDEMHRLDNENDLKDSSDSAVEMEDDDKEEDSESDEDSVIDHTNDTIENVPNVELPVNEVRIGGECPEMINEESNTIKNSRKLTFAEETRCNEDELQPIRIYFKHSNVLPVSQDSTSTENIKSPTDIYKSVCNFVQTPRSILKKSQSMPENFSGNTNKNSVKFERNNQQDDNLQRPRIISKENIQVIGNVVEHSQKQLDTSQSTSRPVSRFKASRQAAKNT